MTTTVTTSVFRRAAFVATAACAALLASFALAQSGPPTITSGPSASEAEITDTSAVVRWSTNVESTTAVDFGTTSSFGQTYRKIVPIEETEILELSHSMTLWGLTPGTEYFYRVRSSAGGAEATSSTQSFRTAAVPESCTADTWSCRDWSACAWDGKAWTQLRSCIIEKDCPTATTPKPAEKQSCPAACDKDEWTCGAWGTCVAGKRGRTCSLKTDCPGVETPSPATSEACVGEVAPLCAKDEYQCRTNECRFYEGEGWLKKQECRITKDCPGVDTTPTLRHEPCCVNEPEGDKWVCGEWGACVSGVQNRECVLRPDCPDISVPSPETTRKCESAEPADIRPAGADSSVNASVNVPADIDAESQEPAGGADPLAGASDELRELVRGAGAAIDAYEREADAVADGVAPGGMDANSTELPASGMQVECGRAGIDADRCRDWFIAKYSDEACRRAGIFSAAACEAFLRRGNAGTFPGCEDATPEQCKDVRRRALAGYFDEDAKSKIDALIGLGEKEGVVPPLPGIAAIGEGGIGGASWFPAAPADGQGVAPAVIVRDADRDGLPDDLEVARGTDPKKADTDGDGVGDGEELKKGTNPLGPEGAAPPLSPVEIVILNRLPLQQPLGGVGTVDPAFIIDLASDTSDDPTPATTDVPRDVNEPTIGKPTNSSGSGTQECRSDDDCPPEYPACYQGRCVGDGHDSNEPFKEQAPALPPRTGQLSEDGALVDGVKTMQFGGKAEPNATVLVYVYSYIPMVLTAQTDEDGNFTVEIENDVLAEGEHEMYVAITDETGTITKKSNPLSFFVKEAQAVSEDEYLQPDFTPTTEPIRQWQRAYLIGTVAAMVFALAVVWYFFGRKLGELPPAPPEKQ